MSTGPPIPEIQHFQNLTLKIKGHGHRWGHSLKSQCGSTILSTHIPFLPCQSGIPFVSYDFLKNLTLKIKGQGHWWGHSSNSQCGSSILSTHIPFVPCQSALPFLRYSIFKIWPWKSRVKVMSEVTVQRHNVGLTSYRLIPFVPCQSALPFLIQHFQNLPLKIKGQGQMTLMLQNYRSRQFHRTSNGINPSSGFKDMGSAKSGPSAAWFDKFLAHGQTHMGQMGK